MEEYRDEEKLGEDLVDQITGDYINNFDEAGRRLNISKSGRYQGGQTDYNTGVGFFLGMSGEKFKFSIGDPAGNYMTWDGTTLSISGTITASTFQTAASGQRVVLSGADNTLRFYDASGQVIGIGTSAGWAMQVDPTSGTNNGVRVGNTAVAGIGFAYYNTGNVTSYGLDVILSGVTNTGAGVQINNAGTTGSFGILMTASNAAVGIYMTISGSGNGITINSSGTSQKAIEIISVNQGPAMLITNNASGGNPTGLKLDVSNSGGNGYGFEFAGDIQTTVTTILAGAVPNNKIRVLLPSGVVGYLYTYDG